VDERICFFPSLGLILWLRDDGDDGGCAFMRYLCWRLEFSTEDDSTRS